MEKVITLDCYPSPLHQAVVSLGPRWLAYAATQQVPRHPPQSHTDKFVEVAKDVAKDIASGLYYLGMYIHTSQYVSVSVQICTYSCVCVCMYLCTVFIMYIIHV